MHGGFTVLVVAGLSATAFATPGVSVSPTTAAGQLDIGSQGGGTAHVVKVAEVSLTTDGSNGLTVSISGGSLTKSGNQTSVPFQVVLVDADAPAPPTSAFTTAASATYTWATLGPGDALKDLYIKFTPSSSQDPGEYAAQVDLSVLDN